MKRVKSVLSIMIAAFMLIGIMPNYDVSAATKVATEDDRVWGQTAYDTALAVCDELYKLRGSKFDNVVVATGTNFPDALSGGYFAKRNNAPILLVNKNYEDKVLAKIKSCMKPTGTIYILGGSAVVRPEYETRLKNAGFNVERLAGKYAVDTNLEILRTFGMSDNTFLVATRHTFYDSLSASSVPLPILLVDKNGLTVNQKAFLSKRGVENFVILGGEKAVPPLIADQLSAYGNVDRCWGQTAVDTSYEIAKRFFPGAKKIVMVTEKLYYDGLSGAPLASFYDSPILLVGPDERRWTPAHNFVLENKIRKDLTIGGTLAVTDKTIANVMTWYENNHTHSYGDPTWTWTGYDKAVAKFTCTSKDDTKEVTATITNKVTKEATETEAGTRTYTATVKGPNGKTYTNSKTETIPKKNHEHSYGNPSWTWTGYDKAVAKFTCTSNDDTKEVTATITNKVTKEATETEAGIRVYTATVTFNNKNYTNAKTETFFKTHVHTFNEPTWTWDEKTFSYATARFKCVSDFYTKDVNAIISRETTKPATETSTGIRTYTAEVTGPDGKVYTDNRTEVIPKAKHVHDFSGEWKFDEDGHWHECASGDGVTDDVRGHNWRQVLGSAFVRTRIFDYGAAMQAAENYRHQLKEQFGYERVHFSDNINDSIMNKITREVNKYYKYAYVYSEETVLGYRCTECGAMSIYGSSGEQLGDKSLVTSFERSGYVDIKETGYFE